MTQQNTKQHKTRLQPPRARPLALLLAIVFGIQSSAAYALDPFDVAQSPLVSGGGIEPNLIYIHDDSRSMNATIAPDMLEAYGAAGLIGWKNPFTAADQVYAKRLINSNQTLSGSYLANPVLVMNHEFNPMWYDPNKEYLPPLKGDGTSFPQSDPAKAWINGYLLGADGLPVDADNTVDIRTQLPFSKSATRTTGPTNANNELLKGGLGAVSNLSYHYAVYDPVAVNAQADAALAKGVADAKLPEYPRCDTSKETTKWPPNEKTSAITKFGAGGTVVPQIGKDPSLRYNPNCYMEVLIKDPAQLKNYANWFSYYRNRELTMKAGVSSAFSAVGSGIRLGYGRLNGGVYEKGKAVLDSSSLNSAREPTDVDGKSVTTLLRGVRPFRDYAGHSVYEENQYRSEFFNWLYRIYSEGDTPSREAINAAGQYLYKNDSSSGPWASTPGVASKEPITGCRKSFTILASDGGWYTQKNNEIIAKEATGNVDATKGDAVQKPDKSWLATTYDPAPPFEDGWSATLADVAMYYWKTDLLPDVVNQVPATERDPAIWQHMTLYTIGLGVQGKLEQTEIDRAFKDMVYPSGDPVAWGNPQSSPDVAANPAKIDDMIHAAVNSRGAYFSARDPEEFKKAIENILATIIAETAATASVAVSSGSLTEESMVFQGKYDTDGWFGKFLAYKLCTPDAVKNKTGGCTSEGAVMTPAAWEASGLIPSHDKRNIFSWRVYQPAKAETPSEPAKDAVSAAPILFEWDELAGAQQALLGGDALIVDYLRGDTSLEDAGKYRKRNGEKLGDIVNSAPAYVAAQDYGYGQASGLTLDQRKKYRERKPEIKERDPMVYVGANDGMLHGFDAATGDEKLAYVPASVYDNLKYLAEPGYSHRFFVDGSPKVADAYLSGKGKWRTVLVGSTGAGGRSYFALDVEDPAEFSKKSPADIVLWEFASDKLGVALGQASIVHSNDNGKAVAIFGNGYNSKDHIASLIILDLETGEVIRELDTEAVIDLVTIDGKEESVLQANGLSTPVPVDLNGDGLADIVYAGDMQGHLWRFDISSENSADWSVATTPLLYAEANGRRQPITARPAVKRNDVNGGVMVYVGTGQFFEQGDPETKFLETFYGVWDCPLTSGANCSALGVERADLVARQFTEHSTKDWALRVFEEGDPVDYAGGERGFYIDLVAKGGTPNGERVIAQARTNWEDRIVFSTLVLSGDSCAYGTSQWIMEVDPLNGGRTKNVVFDINGDGKFDASDLVGGQVPNGFNVEGGVGDFTPGGSVGYLTDRKGGAPLSVTQPPPSGIGRQSWRQIR